MERSDENTTSPLSQEIGLLCNIFECGLMCEPMLWTLGR